MSFAIIRNEKYTKDELIQISPHNERVKKKYSNENIDKTKSHLNYHIKSTQSPNYLKEFKRLKEENNLKGQLHKNSIYACEMIITSDTTFFDNLRQNSTNTDRIKQFFQDSFDFVSTYNNLGVENIISAVVHLDEKTPHMHLVFIPVVDCKDKNGNNIRKIGGYDFWKEKNSYNKLQDRFYKYITEKGYNLERGNVQSDRTHLETEDLKKLTNFYDTKALQSNLNQIKSSLINYEDVEDFFKYEDFTKENVNKKLLQPMIKYNELLLKQNHDLLVELSKAKNARNYYKNLQSSFNELKDYTEELQSKISKNKIELDACYGVIKQELNKNEKLQKILKEKLGISFDEDKQKTKD